MNLDMKKTALLLTLVGAGILANAPASAQWHHHGPRVGIGLNFGFGAPWPGYYYPPAYYPPRVVVVQQPAPPVYVEQPQYAQAAPQIAPAVPPAADWYYCSGANGYYPYVRECPGGWQRVPATPPR